MWLLAMRHLEKEGEEGIEARRVASKGGADIGRNSHMERDKDRQKRLMINSQTDTCSQTDRQTSKESEKGATKTVKHTNRNREKR